MSGGGGGGGNATQTQVTDLPDWAKPYAKESLGQAAALTDLEKNPYQAYSGDRQADFTGLQTKAFQGADTMAPSAAMGTAAQMAGQAGLGALGAGSAFNPYQTGQFTGQTAQSYMNPYMQNVVDIQKREAQRSADIAGTQRAGQATRAGAFGGSRQAIMEAEAGRNLAQQMGDIQATGQQAAYQDAASRFAQEQQLREQSRQYGAGLGMQGYQTALTGAGQLANIGQQTFGQEMDINKLQQQYGTQQQAFAQQGMDTRYQDFLNQQRYPYQQLEFMNSMLRGTPMGTVSSMYAPAPSAMSQIAGLGTAAYGVSQMAEGGEVPGYAVGGGITGLLKDDQLQQRVQNPTVTSLARMAAQDEMQERGQFRAGAAPQAPQGEQPSVAEEYMMSRGVASLPTEEMNLAGGGILAFAGGGDEGKKRYMPLWERAEKQRREKGSIYSPDFGTPIDERIAKLEDDKKRRAALGREAVDKEEENPYDDTQRFANQADAAKKTAPIAAPPATGPGLGLGSKTPLRDLENKMEREKEAAASKAPAEKAPTTSVPAPKPVNREDVMGLYQQKGDPYAELKAEQQKVNRAKEDAAKQGIANIKRDQEAMGEYGTEREAKLKEQEAGLAGLEKRNKSMAFIEAGLAIMSGNSANAFENIGKGALVGTKAYKAGMDKIDEKRTKLDEAFMNLYDIRRGEKVANKKELRAAENAFENAKVDSAQAMASITGKKTEADVANFAKGVDAYVKMSEGALDRASRENVANIGASATRDAATARAGTLTEYQKGQLRTRAATTVDARIKADVILQNKVRKDPTLRDRLVQKEYEGVLGAMQGGASGQGGAGDSTMDFDAQGNPI